jgi:hypothetical protein
MQRQDQTCVRSMMPIQKKQLLDLFFSAISKKYLQSSLKNHIGQTQLVPRLHITICQVK